MPEGKRSTYRSLHTYIRMPLQGIVIWNVFQKTTHSNMLQCHPSRCWPRSYSAFSGRPLWTSTRHPQIFGDLRESQNLYILQRWLGTSKKTYKYVANSTDELQPDVEYKRVEPLSPRARSMKCWSSSPAPETSADI